MIVTLNEAKEWLRVDHNEDDTLIQSLITASEQYLKNATGIDYDDTNELAKVYCMVLITDWYEKRELTEGAYRQISNQTRYVITSILMQLTYGSDSQ